MDQPSAEPETHLYYARCSTPGGGPGPMVTQAPSAFDAAFEYAEKWPECGLVGVEVVDTETGETAFFHIDVAS